MIFEKGEARTDSDSVSLLPRNVPPFQLFLCISPRLSNERANQPILPFFDGDGKLGHEVFGRGKNRKRSKKLPAVFTADTFFVGKKYRQRFDQIFVTNLKFSSPL